MRRFAIGILVLALATPALAQVPKVTGAQEPGQRAGSSYIPSTHTPGCGGLFCDGNDLRVAAAPRKPCAAVICDDPPFTARDAQLAQERARAEAGAAAAAPPAPAKQTRVRKARAKAPKAAVAARTPAPAEAAAPAR